MDSRLAYRPDTSSSAQAIPAGQRVMQVAEAASWAVMVLGLIAASLVLVQSYLLGG
jgi:ketol-acid reductoisomerase